MRTWAIHPKPDRRSAGFTLLEILMVLVLLGLVTGLVAPRLGSLYQSLSLREQRENLLHQIETLPYKAFQTGQTYRLADPAASTEDRLEGLEGWKLESDRAIVFRANGVCTGGTLRIRHEEGEVWEYILRPPYCKAEVSDETE